MNSNLGSIGTGAGGVVREEQNMVLTKVMILGPVTHKINNDHRTFHTDATLCVESESVLRNILPLSNLEARFNKRFLLLPSRGSFLFRRKERHDQTDFKNEIYA